MKKTMIASIAAAIVSTTAAAEDVKIGMLQGFTGPTESLVAPMALGGELAIKEVSDSGQLLGGMKVESVRGDSTCIDAAAATAAAERLITSDGVAAIKGATCSGATTAVRLSAEGETFETWTTHLEVSARGGDQTDALASARHVHQSFKMNVTRILTRYSVILPLSMTTSWS